MPGRSFRVARIAGIPVGISPLWFIIVALITWSLGASYYPNIVHGIAPLAAYGLGLLSALLLFASILAHEFGHAIVARRRGIEIEGIDLWLLGGVARMTGRPHTAQDELRFSLAGPLITAVVAIVFTALRLGLPGATPAALKALLGYQAEVNWLILIFNLIPAFPLDGGRVARALLWMRTGDIASATDTAATLGRGFGYLLIAGGIVLWLYGAFAGLWFVVIGFFLVSAAGAERVQEQVLSVFAGVRARELMSEPPVMLHADATLIEAQTFFASYRFTAFPVIDADGRAVGLFSIGQLERTSRERWTATTVGALAYTDHSLLIGPYVEVAGLLELPAFQRVGRAVVIDENGRPIGVVSITDVQRVLRARRLGDPMRRPPRLAPRH